MVRTRSVRGWMQALALGVAACSGNAPLPVGDPPAVPVPEVPPGEAVPPFDGEPVSAAKPPPPLSGGTLLALNDGATVVASDPDRDTIFVANVEDKKLVATIQLQEGDEPGRAVQDHEGNVHVLLRGAGKMITLRPGVWQVTQRREICPAPRGLAFDGSALWVACAGGEVKQFPPRGNEPSRSFHLDKDLRDVVFTGDTLLVTRFRTAEILVLSPQTGEVLSQAQAPGSELSRLPSGRKSTAEPQPIRLADPDVAWRMRPLSGGGAVILHQEAGNETLGIERGGYGGGGCESTLAAAVTTVGKDGTLSTSGRIAGAVLPVDVDVSPNGPCHPEGGEDGRVWSFDRIGERRTQSLRGGIMHLAPFHWDGDMKDLSTLMTEVFTGRMGGMPLGEEHVKALGKYLDGIPALPTSPPRDPAAVGRGEKLFRDNKVGCATCHGGADFTNNLSMEVGTGRRLQVPTLKGVSWRAPFMHTGCAKTMADRFDAVCGGGDAHGVTSHLSPSERADLSAFMETL